jgi:hypothetical protein
MLAPNAGWWVVGQRMPGMELGIIHSMLFHFRWHVAWISYLASADGMCISLNHYASGPQILQQQNVCKG